MRTMNNRSMAYAVMLCVALAAAGVARGQSTATPNAPEPDQNVVYVRTGPGMGGPGDALDFVGFEAGLGGKTVTGAPFTATISVNQQQTLADGNEINRTTTGTIARDSQGRIRRDMALPAIGPFAAASQSAPHVVFINDVVSGTQYILDPERKIAHEIRLAGRGKRLRMRQEIRSTNARPNVATTSLGTQTINGVEAEGTRYTRTIPAGQIGNEKPIVITTERWYSPDLQMYVLTKSTNPLSGNSVRQLTDIQMGEPDPALFQVPSDYTIKKGGMVRIRRRIGIGAGGGGPQIQGPVAPDLPPPPQN
jgi:hypothetical protein